MIVREKIMVGLAVAALIYGGFTVVLPKLRSSSNQHDMKQTIDVLRNMTEQTRRKLQTNALTRAERRVLESAVCNWATNPFSGQEVDVGKKISASGIVYTGYLNVSGEKIAVVNGSEYRIKETLNSNDFVVESIERERVVLSLKGRESKLVVPMAENKTAE